MQELGRNRPPRVPPPAIQRFLLEGKGFERAVQAPSVQLIARDAFVAETAVKLDQVVAEIKAMGRELQLVKSDLAELRDDSSRSYRFAEFLDREHKLRAAKLDELARRFDYLKLRFDAVDGNSKGDYHAFQNFEAVSRRLTELGAIEREFRGVSRQLKLSAGLFLASVVMWISMLTFG